MSETPSVPSLLDDKEARLPLIIYLLYLAGFITGGVTTIIGVVVAYVNKGDGADWIQDHFTFQIRTFWLGLLLIIVASILAIPLWIVLIGPLLPLLVGVWFIIRCVIGLKHVSRREPHPNPTTWKW